MTSFRFVHAADLHLGSPFDALGAKDAAVAERFARATREAFTALVDETIARGAAFMVIAGDTFDGEWKDTRIGLFFNREVARLAREGIAVVTLRGNHDAASVVGRSVPLPDTVFEFPTDQPATHRLLDGKVALHGQGFAHREEGRNLARTYPPAVAGAFNIGVLHTALAGRPGHDTYAPASVADLAARGYDYWALGHVHAYEEVAREPWIVFPGNLQGRNVRERGPKGAVLVEVEDGSVRGVERLIVDRARWGIVTLDVSELADSAAIQAAFPGAARPIVAQSEGRACALRVRLTGRCAFLPALRADAETLRDDLSALLQIEAADAWLEKLELAVEAPPLAAEGEAAGLAALLTELATAPEAAERAEAIITELRGRLPPGVVLDEDPEALLAEAADLALAHLPVR